MKQPWENCNAESKPFYTVAEAAIRWCELTKIEHAIQIDQSGLPEKMEGYPCLRVRAEKILYALTETGELPRCRDGKLVAEGDTVAKARLTVRHDDLKQWVDKKHPGEKPPFLFDEIERTTHPSINAESFRVLQADLKARDRQLIAAKEERDKLQSEVYRLQAELTQAKAQAETEKPLRTRERDGLLRTIGAIALMLVERGGQRMGTVDDPTFKQLAESIGKFMAKESLSESDGMSSETLRKRLKEGVDTLKGA